MYRFLLRPRWLAFTLAIVMLMVAMSAAARWQWHRYEFKRDRADIVAARSSTPPVALSSILSRKATSAAVIDAEWTIVALTGTYRADEQVAIKNRSQDGLPGQHVVTPLVLTDGSAVAVNRGFLGLDASPPSPPTGTVSVEGRVRRPQTRGSLGPRDPATGKLTSLARVDIARLGAQTTEPLWPLYVELIAPADPDLVPVSAPDRDLGPHLSYMGQWIIFTICAATGWSIVVRRAAKKQSDPDAHQATLDEAASHGNAW